MYKNLRDFVKKLEKNNQLLRISAPVSSSLKISEITDRISKTHGGGKALLFENTATDFPVLTNMMGSRERISMALGVEHPDDLRVRIADIIKGATSPKNSFSDKLKMLPLLAEMSRWLPKHSKSRGECQSVVYMGDEVDLDMLPILKCWPEDGGRFVTLPLVHTLDPETEIPNLGMYRMQQLSKNTTGMHWHIHKTGARHARGYAEQKKIMPVTVCLGGDPSYTYVATAPMPDNMDEYLLAGFIRKKSVKLVKSLTNDIWIPSNCDFVLEGYVDFAEGKVVEGPFGDHTGFYSLTDNYPVFHVTALTHRKDAIYPATLVGVPPQEDAYIAEASEKIFLEPMRLALQPELCDMYMPFAGVAHNLALISLKTSYAAQVKKVASSLWGAGQMMFNKVVVLCPESTDVRNIDAVSELVQGFNPQRDSFFSSGVYDVLDHASSECGQGGKLALDLSSGGEIEPLVYDPESEGIWTYAKRWRAALLPCDEMLENTEARGEAKRFIDENNFSGIKFIVLLSEAQSELRGEDLLWQITANIEPQRDVEIYENVMIVDARCKISKSEGNPERWPNVVVSDKQTIKLVDKRWSEYKIGEKISSPSLIYSKLSYGEGAQR